MKLDIVGPEEVLKRGGVEWKAELVEVKEAVQAGYAGGQVNTAKHTSVPNHAVITSVVPRQTASPSAGKKEGGEGETLVFSQTQEAASSLPVEILASDTIKLSNNDEEAAPKFPCPKLFLHLVVRETGVPIPPPSRSASASSTLFKVAERIFGPLTNTKEKEGGRSARERETAPIHLTLERLYLGGIPATAFSMVLPMFVMVLVGWFGIRPMLDGLIPRGTSKEGKAE